MSEEENLINPDFDKIGYIQIYTGNGKGKTTASLGLALRALGRGWKVLIVLFTKGGSDYGELFAFREFSPKIKKHVKIIQAGLDRIVYSNNLTENDKQTIRKGWEEVKQSALSNEYQLIIMDEANIAIDLDIIKVEEMKEFLLNKPKELEVVLTGRHAHPEIVELAHLVSNIQPIKHYWDIGVQARKGIEY